MELPGSPKEVIDEVVTKVEELVVPELLSKVEEMAPELVAKVEEVMPEIAEKIEVSPISQILIKALQEPLRQNLLNMGIKEKNWGNDIVDSKNYIVEES